MALSPLGRAALQLRWDNFLKTEGSSLFLALKAAPKDSDAYEAAMSEILDRLKASFEYDFHPASVRGFIEEKLVESLSAPPAGQPHGNNKRSR